MTFDFKFELISYKYWDAKLEGKLDKGKSDKLFSWQSCGKYRDTNRRALQGTENLFEHIEEIFLFDFFLCTF